MRLDSLAPPWVGWLAATLAWAGIGVLWYIKDTTDHNWKLLMMGVAALAGVISLVRGVRAYARRNEPPTEKGSRDEPDFPQMLIFALVAGVVVESLILSFDVLRSLSQMQ